MKYSRRYIIEGVELSNQVVIRTLREKDIYKYLWILEVDTIKQLEMKEKIKKWYIRRIRKLLEIELYSRNLVKGINTSAVSVQRFLK